MARFATGFPGPHLKREMWGTPALPLWGMLLRNITTCRKIILFSGSALCNITNQHIRPETILKTSTYPGDELEDLVAL
jgi:hypothetical protein